MTARRYLAAVGSLAATTLLTLGPGVPAASAAGPPPSFTICPPAGAATGCGVVVVINADGSRTVVDNPAGTASGVYDASEDSLIGVQNNSASPVSTVALASTSVDIFGFDGDGPCTVTPPEADCGSDPSGYGSPGATFSNISADTRSGQVDFAPAIPPGGTAWFALEGLPDASTIIVPVSVLPLAGLPVAMIVGTGGLVLCWCNRRRLFGLPA